MRNRSWSVVGMTGAALWLSGCGETAPEVKPQEFDVLVAEPRGQLLKGATVKIHGFIIGGEASQVMVGKAAATLGPGGRWEADVPAGTDGAHSVTVTARAAKGGKQASVDVAWMTDNTAPVVTITSPDGATALRGDAVRVEGTVTDTSPVSVLAQGRPVQLDGTRFEFTQMLIEGENTAVVEVTDAAGHAVKHEVTIVRDTQAPSVTLAATPAKVANPVFAVTGDVSEARCRVFVNGEEAVVEGQGFRFDLALEPGANPFIVVVRDAGGLESTAEGSVVLELRKPLTTQELLARFGREASSGSGWYDGQYDDLLSYGAGIHPALIQVAEQLCRAEGQREVAIQACQCLAELGVTDAVPMLSKIVETSRDPNLIDSLVFILARLGDTSRAEKIIEALRQEIETNPGSGPQLWVRIGNGYARMSNYAKAEDGYRKAIALATELGQAPPGVAYYNLACQLAKLDKNEEAMQALHERMKLPQPDVDWMATDGDLASLREHPEFLKYLYSDGKEEQLVRRAAMVSRTHPKSGNIVLRKGVERFPTSATMLVYLAVGLAGEGELEEGAKALAQANGLARGGLNWKGLSGHPALQALKKLPNWEALSTGAAAPVPPKKEEKKEDF